jgi:crotonobetainyl-CoA:carnitine CoA-transferase CaiB-like acyl-CoA transferase
MTAPADLMQTADGSIVISAYLPEHWAMLCNTLGVQGLIDDPRFATKDRRVANRLELVALLEQVLVTNTTDHWAALLLELGLVIGRVRTYADVARSPQLESNGIWLDVPTPGGGSYRTMKVPFRTASETHHEPTPAPELGEHTAEILTEIGLGSAPAS